MLNRLEVVAMRRWSGRAAGAAALLALACGAPAKPPAPAAAAPGALAEPAANATPAPDPPKEAAAPAPLRHGSTPTADGKTFEAEYGGESQLPSDFPNDVPIYAAAHPMSSMSSVTHGTIVNLRSTDPPDAVFDWYRAQMPAAGWEIEHEAGEHGRHLLGLRKGNRIASIVVTGVPEYTNILLTLREDR